ncbi:MAG TPA: DUF2889 domain-containing protein [Acetobacteraceae bacterium]|nr:DUF2889 domain-containing protein [Acetobacteraceae bacterium]
MQNAAHPGNWLLQQGKQGCHAADEAWNSSCGLHEILPPLNVFVRNYFALHKGPIMPLSPPADRKLLHARDIQLRGYAREDGLIDIEAQMTDTKTYSFCNGDRGLIPAGEPLHHMFLRLTIDQNFTVQSCEATMEKTPYSICPGVAPNFARLAGLTIGKGFLKGAMAQVGGVEGCTHLRELLQQVATVAFQTMFSVKSHLNTKDPKTERISVIPPSMLNSCHAYNESGPVVARHRERLAAKQTA